MINMLCTLYSHVGRLNVYVYHSHATYVSLAQYLPASDKFVSIFLFMCATAHTSFR